MEVEEGSGRVSTTGGHLEYTVYSRAVGGYFEKMTR